MTLPVAGVQLVAQDYAQFMSAILNASNAVSLFGKATSSAGTSSMQTFTDGTRQAASGMEGLNVKSLIGANIIGSVLTDAIYKVVGAFQQGTQAVKGFVTEGIGAAARVQELDFVIKTIGRTAGYSAEQIDEQVAGIIKMGIQSDQARQAAILFVQANLDLTKSSELARMAQDAAVIGALNSSEAFNRLTYAITRMDTQMLRTMGIIIDRGAAEDEYAKTLGKTASQMTSTEKQAAFLNATLKAGAQIAGTYEAAMQTPGKQMRSLERDIFELSRVIGEVFLNAYSGWATTLRNVAGGMRMLFDEGGPLRGMMITIGAAVSFVTDKMESMSKAFSDAAKQYAESGTGFFKPIVDSFTAFYTNYIQPALQWGFDLVVNLASGIIEGAASVLISAMEFLGSILTWWLAPGSPPNIVPNIDDWGAGTINAWLQGFSEADFSLVDAISAPLKSAMKLATDMGMIDESGANLAMAEIIKSTIAAASGVGTMEEVLSKIRATAGPFANEVALLAEKQFSLAASTKEVVYWENQMIEAQKRAAMAGKEVNTKISEYNKMLKSGASKAALKVKLAEINASKTAQSTAMKEAQAAAEKANAAAEGIQLMKEQISLQSKLIDQMNELAQLQIAAVKAAEQAAKGGGGGRGAGAGGLAIPPELGAGGGASGGIDEAIEKMKETIKLKAGEIFQPLIDAWEHWGGVFTTVQTKFTNFWEIVKEFAKQAWNFALLVWEAIKTGDWEPVKQVVIEKLTAVWASIKTLLTESENPIISALGTSLTTGDWGPFGTALQTGITTVINTAMTVIGTAMAGSENPIISALGGGLLTGDWTALQTTVSEGITGIINGVAEAVKTNENLKPLIDTFQTLYDIVTGIVAPIVAFVAAFGGMLVLIGVAGMFAEVAASSGPLVAIFGILAAISPGLVGFIASVVIGLQSFGATLALIGAPILIVAGIVALAIAAIVGNWYGVRDAIIEGIATMQQYMLPFSALWEQLKTAFDALVVALQPLMPVFKAVSKFFVAFYKAYWGIVAALAGGILVGLITGIVSGITTFVQGLVLLVTGIVQVITGVINVVVGLFEAIFAGSSEEKNAAFAKMWLGIQEIITGVWNIISGVVVGTIKTIVDAIAGFIAGVVAFFQGLYDILVGNSIIPDMMQAIEDFIVGGLEAVVKLIAQPLLDFVAAIQTKVTEISTWVSETWDTLWAGVVSLLETYITGPDGIMAKIAGFVTSFQAKINEFTLWFSEAWSTLWSGIKTTITTALTGPDGIITKIGGFVTDAKAKVEEFKTWLSDTWSALWTGVVATTDTYITGPEGLLSKVGGIVTGITDIITNAYDALVAIGGNIIQGLVDGITNYSGESIAGAAVSAAQAAVTAVKNKLEEKSPSRVFMEIGANMSIGMAEGIKAEDAKPVTATVGLAGDSYAAFERKIADMQMRINQTKTSLESAAVGAANRMVSPVENRMRVAPVQGGASRIVNITFGDVTIGSAEDMDNFQGRVEQAVLNALGQTGG